MKHFAQVESSLKGGCDVRLGRHSVVVGDNGAGKSTIVQALQLATTGAVSDMEGRENVKLHTSLARLFSTSDRFARAVLSDGTTFEWSMEDGNKEGALKKPKHDAPMTVRWPLQDLSAVLKGDATTVSAWLENRVVGSLTAEELLSVVPPGMRDHVQDFIQYERKLDFIALAKKAKSEARKLRMAATKSDSTIESMLEGVAPPMLEVTRKKLESDLAALGEPTEGVTQERYDEIKGEIVKLAEAYVQVAEHIADLSDAEPGMISAVKKLEHYIELCDIHARELSGQDCWVCGQGTAEDILTQRVELQSTYESLVAASKGFSKRKEFETQAEILQNAMQEKVDYLKSLKIVNREDQDRRSQIVARMTQDAANRRTWENAEANRLQNEQSRARADILTLVAKTLEKAGKRVLSDKKSAFEEAVSAFLPAGETLGVDLDSGRLGLIREGKLHTALSGAEWSRVLLALAVSQEGDSNLPCVMVPEDRAWDGGTLSKVMESLSGAPCQIIIMSTVAPETPVEGWSLVEV